METIKIDYSCIFAGRRYAGLISSENLTPNLSKESCFVFYFISFHFILSDSFIFVNRSERRYSVMFQEKYEPHDKEFYTSVRSFNINNII